MTIPGGLKSVPALHPTWVAIVMAARDSDHPEFSGIAYRLPLISLDFVDDLRQLERLVPTIQISMHSYVYKVGWCPKDPGTFRRELGIFGWVGGQDAVADGRFGKYSDRNAAFDRILAANPHLVSFVAAGNELDYIPDHQPLSHWVWEIRPETGQPDWVQIPLSAAPKRRPDLSDDGSLDTIAGLGLSKNCLCVGALEPQYGPNDLLAAPASPPGGRRTTAA